MWLFDHLFISQNFIENGSNNLLPWNDKIIKITCPFCGQTENFPKWRHKHMHAHWVSIYWYDQELSKNSENHSHMPMIMIFFFIVIGISWLHCKDMYVMDISSFFYLQHWNPCSTISHLNNFVHSKEVNLNSARASTVKLFCSCYEKRDRYKERYYNNAKGIWNNNRNKLVQALVHMSLFVTWPSNSFVEH